MHFIFTIIFEQRNYFCNCLKESYESQTLKLKEIVQSSYYKKSNKNRYDFDISFLTVNWLIFWFLTKIQIRIMTQEKQSIYVKHIYILHPNPNHRPWFSIFFSFIFLVSNKKFMSTSIHFYTSKLWHHISNIKRFIPRSHSLFFLFSACVLHLFLMCMRIFFFLFLSYYKFCARVLDLQRYALCRK